MKSHVIESKALHLLGVVLLGLALVLPTAAFAAEEDVYGDTFDGTSGWMFNRDTNNATPIEFNDDTATLGEGALYVEPIANDAPRKFIGELFPGELLVSDFNSFMYDFQIGAGGDVSDANEFYLNVYTISATPGSSWYDCKFDYVPTVGAVGSFTTFSALATDTPSSVTPKGGTVCPATLAEMPAGSVISFFAINLGDTSLSDVGVDGYFDNVVVDLAAGVTTYDFEPVPMVAPVVAIDSPVDGATVMGTIDISGSVTDDIELSLYNISLYPADVDLSDGETHSSDRLNDANWCGGSVFLSDNVTGVLCADWDTTQYADGDYQIRLAARDAAGNRDTSNAYTGGDSSVHVITITIDNVIDREVDGKDVCKDGGWEAYGFKNQGQCVRYIETGKDSR